MMLLTSPVLCECDMPFPVDEDVDMVVAPGVVGPNLFDEDEDEDVEDFLELYSRCNEYCDDCCCCCCCGFIDCTTGCC